MPISKKNNLHIGLPSRWTDFLLHLNRYIRVCIMNLSFWKILIVACNTNHTWQREENHTRTFCSEKHCLKNNPVKRFPSNMHSSRMRTARLLTVSGGGVCPTRGVCIQEGLPNPGGSAQPGVGWYPGGSAQPQGGLPTWGVYVQGESAQPQGAASCGVGQTPSPCEQNDTQI